MNLAKYDIDIKPDFKSFEFFSEGPKGKIKKVIQFTRINGLNTLSDTYNLGFGDYDEGKGRIDDLIVSDNKDSEKVLSTVATAVILFTNKYPKASVVAQGSTPARMRYYIMGIARHLPEIIGEFEIWGAIGKNNWEPFRKNMPYLALLVNRK